MTQPLTPDCLPAARSTIAVLGATNLDISAGSKTPLKPGDSTPGLITTSAGGVARNVAENLARLGHASCLISAVGDDLHGQFLLDHTRAAGVDVSRCRVWPGQRSGSYLSISNADASLLAAVNDMAVLDLLSPAELAGQSAFLASASAWVVDCNLSEASFAELMQHKSAAPVFVDGVSSHKCTKALPWLGAIHTLKINRLEAQTLCGAAVETAAQASVAAQSLCARGVENVVVSLGSGGVCWHQRSSDLSGHVPALKITAINSNGAGDALMAGLVHGALQRWPLEQSVCFANACAALTMTHASANHPQLSVANAKRLMASPVPGEQGLIQP